MSACAALQAAGLAAWKDSVLALNPACADLLAHIRSTNQLTWARYNDIVMPRYHNANAVVIGNAAHASSPQRQLARVARC